MAPARCGDVAVTHIRAEPPMATGPLVLCAAAHRPIATFGKDLNPAPGALLAPHPAGASKFLAQALRDEQRVEWMPRISRLPDGSVLLARHAG